jgi:hypothetical protein
MSDGTRLRIDILDAYGARYCSHKHDLLFSCRMQEGNDFLLERLRSAHMRGQRTNLRKSPCQWKHAPISLVSIYYTRTQRLQPVSKDDSCLQRCDRFSSS